MSYNIGMFSLIQSKTFQDWFKSLRDKTAKTRITFRLLQAEQGNLGDSAAVGEGVSEMRIHLGAGYRVYYTKTEKTVIILLVGGDKSSQDRDIKRAIKMARELK